jgi:nucleoid-associated protein YgaU
MARYDSTRKGTNSGEFYEELREIRNVKKLEQYRTPEFPILTAKVRRRFSSRRHIWSTGDSYWKLASKHYGDPKLWWIIAWYNEKPTESHVETGMLILIPTPVEEVVSFFHFGA